MSKELIPTFEELGIYQAMATTATKSKMFSKIGEESGLLSLMLMARELGLPPMQSIMGGLNIIQGKVEISPRMMNTMIRKAGHKLEIIDSSDQICKIKGIRHDTKEEYVSSFSLDDARKAGLVKSGGAWEKYASDMLFARCISRLARRLFADVISTAYVEGEIDREDEISKPLVQESKTLEADVIEETISTVDAHEIENLLASEDTEYRCNLLKYYTGIRKLGAPMTNFFGLPKRYLTGCLNSIDRHRTARLKKNEDAAVVNEFLGTDEFLGTVDEDIPF